MDVNTGGIADSFANFVWEPAVVKVFSSFQSAYLFVNAKYFADVFTRWLFGDFLISADQCYKCGKIGFQSLY